MNNFWKYGAPVLGAIFSAVGGYISGKSNSMNQESHFEEIANRIFDKRMKELIKESVK